MTLEAVIFDMDDLMINSHPAHMKIFEAVLRMHNHRIRFYSGKNILTPAEEADFFGLRIPEIMARLAEKYGVTTSVDELNNKYDEMLLRDFGQFVKPMPGIYALVDSLHDYKLAIASSSPKRKIDIVLSRLNLHGVFEAVVSGEEDIIRGKPFPDIFLKAAEKLNVSPGQCVVLEDAKNGVEAAKAAGMYCIGVHNQYTYLRLGIRQDLSRADLVVDSLEELSVDKIKSAVS